MELQWLLPEQIDQILKLCELSSVEDLTVAANILENNQWDLEVLFYLSQKAMHDVVNQNDQMQKQEQQKKQPKPVIASKKYEEVKWEGNAPFDVEGQFELGPQDYQQLLDNGPTETKPKVNNHSALLAQQNFEYE